MYDLINTKKLDVRRIATVIIILIISIVIINFFIIKSRKKMENKLNQNNILQVACQGIIFEDDEEDLTEKIKIFNGFSEEQIKIIENIYKDTGEKRVFLTFDDGPSKAVTPHILDILKKEKVKATFFVLGNNVEINQDLIKRAFQEGHYIANHGYSHVYSNIYKSKETVFDEYNKTEKAIQVALDNNDYHSNLFRFPGGSSGGKYNKLKQEAIEEFKKNNITYLDWNALSNDSAGAKTKEELMENIIKTVGEKKSVVILMHDAGDKISTYETLPEIIKYLREKGYKFQNIYDILE